VIVIVCVVVVYVSHVVVDFVTIVDVGVVGPIIKTFGVVTSVIVITFYAVDNIVVVCIVVFVGVVVLICSCVASILIVGIVIGSIVFLYLFLQIQTSCAKRFGNFMKVKHFSPETVK
jgi:hypothetical protein